MRGNVGRGAAPPRSGEREVVDQARASEAGGEEGDETRRRLHGQGKIAAAAVARVVGCKP